MQLSLPLISSRHKKGKCLRVVISKAQYYTSTPPHTVLFALYLRYIIVPFICARVAVDRPRVKYANEGVKGDLNIRKDSSGMALALRRDLCHLVEGNTAR